MKPPAQTVLIDIKPHDPENRVRLRPHGHVTVAILSSTVFDATKVKPGSVTLAGADIKRVGRGDRYLYEFRDVNRDGLLDFVCEVYIDEIEVDRTEPSQILELKAETFEGQKIRGEDEVDLISKRSHCW